MRHNVGKVAPDGLGFEVWEDTGVIDFNNPMPEPLPPIYLPPDKDQGPPIWVDPKPLPKAEDEAQVINENGQTNVILPDKKPIDKKLLLIGGLVLAYLIFK